jgi:glycosyltransferase involved in cell wall biosynthesis
LNYFNLLDKACYIDEKFVSKHKNSVWLPDVFQQYADELITNENQDERVWIERLETFKAKNKGRFIILYFGTAQPRRGYDILLKLAVESNACFVHCGLNNDKENFEFNTDELKVILKKEERILETNQYISDPVCIGHFFGSISHLILPYRKFMGSSGVMLQALGYGIPVLVPNLGIIGYRVNKHNLGLTFDNGYKSLLDQFNHFIRIPKEHFQVSIEEYMQYQSISELKKVLIEVLSNNNTIELPL